MTSSPGAPTSSFRFTASPTAAKRLRRLRQTEADYYQLRAPLLQKDSKRFRAPPELRPSFITCYDADGFPTLQNFSLLESRLERSFCRALHELERRQALRAGLFVPPPPLPK